MGGVTELKNMAEYKKAVEAGGVMILDCFAEWCGPCKMIAPKIEEYSNSKELEKVSFYKVDVDEVPDVAQELGIRAMPTFKIFKDGELVDDVVGANPPAIKAAIEKQL